MYRAESVGSAESLCNTSTNKYRHAKIIVRSDQSMRITFDVPVDERNVVGGGREPAWAAVKSTMVFWSVSEGLGKTREESQNSVNRKEERGGQRAIRWLSVDDVLPNERKNGGRERVCKRIPPSPTRTSKVVGKAVEGGLEKQAAQGEKGWCGDRERCREARSSEER
ncbi:uncharacterized protein G6M90_00g016150 [Metarhizium brunneum]|uniref:Uncharacterized protein n=1 Tax=Metarhizium brunneum TaxID=500148 RepID=A0A7D5UQK8_9HYPO